MSEYSTLRIIKHSSTAATFFLQLLFARNEGRITQYSTIAATCCLPRARAIFHRFSAVTESMLSCEYIYNYLRNKSPS